MRLMGPELNDLRLASSSKLGARSQRPASLLVSDIRESDEECKLTFLFQALSRLNDSTMSLPQLIATSQTTKARLLHYFPPQEGQLPSEDEPVDSWCGFHLDHSLLTGLCSVSDRIGSAEGLIEPHD